MRSLCREPLIRALHGGGDRDRGRPRGRAPPTPPDILSVSGGFLLTLQPHVLIQQADQSLFLQPAYRQALLHRRAVAPSPPPLAAEGAEPGPFRGHAQSLQHPGDGPAALALLEPQATQLVT